MTATKTNKPTKIPTSIRPQPDMLVRIQKIADANGLSASAVINLALAGGMTIVETKLAEIRDNKEASAAVGGAR